MRRSFDSQSDIVPADTQNLNLNLIPDNELFVFFAGYNKHTDASAFRAGHI
jgi:esterase/lipase superfamily enzyme